MSNHSNSASIPDLLLATLGSARNSKRFHAILNERRLQLSQRGSVKSAIFRLQAKGYVANTSAGWYLTSAGKVHVKETHLLGYIASPFKETDRKNIVIAFDVPERDRAKRDWLRNQIKIFGYKMLQQSLWIGPGPLPKSFIKRLEDLNLRKSTKIFKVAHVTR